MPWSDAVAELYRLPERFDETELGLVLDVARDVSKGVARPAAPVSTFLLGVAIGRGLADGSIDAEDRTSGLAHLARQVQAAALAVPLADAGPVAEEAGA
ncbi:MAG: hypothetical protein BGO96_11605 [Micrococcales bacterium 73-15]|nr:MAG: hypothetical protein BGO96_11605 [Micrococcales bacterium 73-15]